MDLSFGDRLGIVGLIMAFLGVALAILWPEKKWIGWLCLGIAVILVISWAGLESRTLSRSNPIKSSVLAGVCFGVLAGFAWFQWMTKGEGTYDPSSLHGMSKQELVETTKKLTDEMISFENDRDKKVTETILSSSQKLAKTTNEEEKNKLNQEIQRASVTAWKDKESEFRKNYLDHASAVRDELLFRLRKTPEQSEKDALATLPPMEQMLHGSLPLSRALGGTLVGPHPIADAAIYLGGLARLLQ